MSKIYSVFLFTFISTVLVLSCKEDESAKPRGRYENGVLIFNEGNFFQANGSVSFFDLDSNKVINNIFQKENGLNLSAILQNAYEYGGKIYIITNSPDKIEVVESISFKRQATINQNNATLEGGKLLNPFDMVAVGNLGYISNWGAYDANFNNPFGSVKILNLSTNAIVDSIPFSNRVMGLLAFNTKVYVANDAGNQVSVINTLTNTIEKNIDIPSPSRFVLDANNKIWVISSAGKLVRINPNTNTIELTIDNIKTSGFNEKIAINNDKNKLFYLSPDFGSGNVEVFALEITATTAPTTALFKRKNLYGIGLGKENIIYLGDSNAFQGNGKVIRLNSNGIIKDSLNVGIAPNGFLFR